MDKEKILIALRMALDKNIYIICETKITILPIQLAIEIYNLLSDDEKLGL